MHGLAGSFRACDHMVDHTYIHTYIHTLIRIMHIPYICMIGHDVDEKPGIHFFG